MYRAQNEITKNHPVSEHQVVWVLNMQSGLINAIIETVSYILGCFKGILS